MKPVQLLALLLAAGCAQAAPRNQAAQEQGPRPDPIMNPEATQEAIMARIERDVRLPEGAAPLDSYARHYAWQQGRDGRRKVVAIYVSAPLAHGSGTPPGRDWVDDEAALPMIDDGGCDVISLRYDLVGQRIEQVVCNGVG